MATVVSHAVDLIIPEYFARFIALLCNKNLYFFSPDVSFNPGEEDDDIAEE